ncbi:uncharacterized protein EI90DRAFT_828791 [Cantharellus anzutake]|uniref:uncharacterized protein n=1 Tax=Cantharellus anzutake TaxID=1750568 RepID=UPI00190653DB|nr:uncharacterized protein EI90DRAFT_828791 [Cantharellus anzutake]KAF8343098.1 hypothetical protein EI90DRAFT_828791 [Cantharellus anzutake]
MPRLGIPGCWPCRVSKQGCSMNLDGKGPCDRCSERLWSCKGYGEERRRWHRDKEFISYIKATLMKPAMIVTRRASITNPARGSPRNRQRASAQSTCGDVHQLHPPLYTHQYNSSLHSSLLLNHPGHLGYGTRPASTQASIHTWSDSSPPASFPSLVPGVAGPSSRFVRSNPDSFRGNACPREGNHSTEHQRSVTRVHEPSTPASMPRPPVSGHPRALPKQSQRNFLPLRDPSQPGYATFKQVPDALRSGSDSGSEPSRNVVASNPFHEGRQGVQQPINKPSAPVAAPHPPFHTHPRASVRRSIGNLLPLQYSSQSRYDLSPIPAQTPFVSYEGSVGPPGPPAAPSDGFSEVSSNSTLSNFNAVPSNPYLQKGSQQPQAMPVNFTPVALPRLDYHSHLSLAPASVPSHGHLVRPPPVVSQCSISRQSSGLIHSQPHVFLIPNDYHLHEGQAILPGVPSTSNSALQPSFHDYQRAFSQDALRGDHPPERSVQLENESQSTMAQASVPIPSNFDAFLISGDPPREGCDSDNPPWARLMNHPSSYSTEAGPHGTPGSVHFGGA